MPNDGQKRHDGTHNQSNQNEEANKAGNGAGARDMAGSSQQLPRDE